MSQKSCSLCQAEKITHRYYEGEMFWVADCKTCNIPMIVLKAHKYILSNMERGIMLDIVNDLFLGKGRLRGYMRAHKEHWHDHIIV